MDQALVATGEGVGVEEEIGHIRDVGDFPTAEILVERGCVGEHTIKVRHR